MNSPSLTSNELKPIPNPCHQLYYNGITQEMLSTETEMFKLVFSTRLNDYVPIHQLPTITHNTMVTNGVCPTLKLITPVTSNCEDTANGSVGIWGDGCEYYDDSPSLCGSFGDADFDSETMCCACGGGEIAP